MTNSALNELGFAEFVAKLISDTFNAILSSQIEQQEKLAELSNLLVLPEDTFLDMSLQDEELLVQLEDYLISEFPFDDQPGHAVFVGAIYQPPVADKAESPPFFDKLGITLFDKVTRKRKLTRQDVERVRREAMRRIANDQRQLLADVVTNGIPKLIVDRAKINAKLTFSIEENQEPEPQSDAATNIRAVNSFTTVSNASLNKLSIANRFAGVVDASKLVNTRLRIAPASKRAPQDAQSSANIYSEVEIHFKSIL